MTRILRMNNYLFIFVKKEDPGIKTKKKRLNFETKSAKVKLFNATFMPILSYK